MALAVMSEFETKTNQATQTEESKHLQYNLYMCIISVSCLSYAVPSISELTLELYSLAEKWESMGKGLEFSDKELERISQEHAGIPEECLIKMLYKWLESTPVPSWRTIIKVLLSADIGERGIANCIAREHC